MQRRTLLQGAGASMLLSALAGAQNAEAGAVFELRVYHASEGKMDALLARFRDHTTKLFARHGITSVAYWTPVDDGPLQGKTLYYVLKYPSREEARVRWKAFQDDPEWVKVRAASEANGKLTEKTESTFLELTDFSPKL